MKNEELIAII